MSNTLFSILVANYNNGLFFKDCYTSIIAQTYKNWQVIIVDDGSTDDSFDEIKRIIGSDSRFLLFRNENNKGCGYTKARCADLAQGQVCGFLDPDDTLVNEALEVMVNAHIENTDVSLVTSKYYRVDMDLNVCAEGSHGESIPEGFSYLTFGKLALTAFATFKREFYQRTGGVNPKFKRAVDQDLYYKLEEVGKHVFLDKLLYNYRMTANSISANANAYKALYWHYVAMKDAYVRRKKDNILASNFSDLEFEMVEYRYFKTRIKYETEKAKYRNKYYFLFKLFFLIPSRDLKYKLKCLLLKKYS